MAERQSQMNSKDVGNVTDSSLRVLRDHGASDAQGVNLKTNQAELIADLDNLVGKGRPNLGCGAGAFLATLEEPLKSKMEEIFINEKVSSVNLVQLLKKYGVTIGSDVMRRHRRTMQGKEGCKCQRES